jgi:hypothetical protein
MLWERDKGQDEDDQRPAPISVLTGPEASPVIYGGMFDLEYDEHNRP